MWDWISDHPFVATLPLIFLMVYIYILGLEYKAKKENPDGYVKLEKRKFWLVILFGTLLGSGIFYIGTKVSLITFIVIIGLPFALISFIGKK